MRKPWNPLTYMRSRRERKPQLRKSGEKKASAAKKTGQEKKSKETPLQQNSFAPLARAQSKMLWMRANPYEMKRHFSTGTQTLLRKLEKKKKVEFAAGNFCAQGWKICVTLPRESKHRWDSRREKNGTKTKFRSPAQKKRSCVPDGNARNSGKSGWKHFPRQILLEKALMQRSNKNILLSAACTGCHPTYPGYPR